MALFHLALSLRARARQELRVLVVIIIIIIRSISSVQAESRGPDRVMSSLLHRYAIGDDPAIANTRVLFSASGLGHEPRLKLEPAEAKSRESLDFSIHLPLRATG